MGNSYRPLSVALCGLFIAAGGGIAEAAKDVGPSHGICDRYAKASGAWEACARQAATDAQLFYAGYWLAKTGRYEEALTYLHRTMFKDARTMTYIGFATRKLGRVKEAMGYYDEALSLDPNFTVARAYLGEAYLTIDAPELAEAELSEIARRCGRSCAAYVELQQRLDTYKQARS